MSLQERSEKLQARFVETYGREPETIWFAPGRVNLIGDHTDYNLGFSLPFAVRFGVLCAAARRNDESIAVASQQFNGVATIDMSTLQPGRIDEWYSYIAGSAYGLREQGVTVGADLMVDGDVPPGAGMSSSAALSCVTALTLNQLAGDSISRHDIALIAQAAEHRFAGTPCGLLDQTASLQSTENHVLLVDFRDMSTTAFPLNLTVEELALLVIDTRAPHRLVDSEYASRRQACESAAKELGVASLRDITDVSVASSLDKERAQRVRHVVTENQRTLETTELLSRGKAADIGPLLTASHISLRDDFQVTVPELDVAVDAALSAGALGARMTGGGFGGSVVALIPIAQRDAIAEAVTSAYARHGFTAPLLLDVEPAAGAHQVL